MIVARFIECAYPILLYAFVALQVAINLPSTSLCCLGALIHHLKPFRLQKVLTITRFDVSLLDTIPHSHAYLFLEENTLKRQKQHALHLVLF